MIKFKKSMALVALVLLTSVVFLPLAGCKNDSVSEVSKGEKGIGIIFSIPKQGSGMGQALSIKSFGDMTIPESFEYSMDGKEWKKLHHAPIQFGGERGDHLYLRGKSEIGTALSISDGLQFYFESDTPVQCSGDIRCLVDWEDPKNADTSKACFSSLFKNCTVLTSAPELPATTLADYCYYQMFSGCSNLTSAPELPATTLADYCYNQMFSDCSNLTSAPELPATTLTYYGCYSEMFSGCSNLTNAPELPATTLNYLCYYRMFSGCNNLNSVTMLATNVDDGVENTFDWDDALNSWLDETSESGTLYVANEKMKTQFSNEKATYSIPDGWNVEVVKK